MPALFRIACARSPVPGGVAVDGRRPTRWRRIAQEAAEQSRRGRVPTVRAPLSLDDALAEAAAGGPALVAWEGERRRSVRDALREVAGGETLSLFVGPEGGFNDAEIARARDLGVLTVSLGPRILRTETAGPVLAALALYEAGELEPAAHQTAEDRCADQSAS